MSSQVHPSFAHKVKDKIFMNVGSLGIDYHREGKHFMQVLSLFNGQGNVSERVRVESVIM
jgi:hypothetical protein